MRIAIVSDAWHPQINGVVRTLSAMGDGLIAAGHEVMMVGPDHFRTVPCPFYRSIRLALFPGRALARLLVDFAPEAVHIATEGPLGISARRFCLRRGWPFTTAYHTKFPEYLRARCGLPLGWSYAALRWFHGPSRGIMVATETVRRELAARGFARVVPWTRGVDTTLFRPGCEPAVELPRPVFLYVGRIAVEKNLPAFLDLDLPGSKLVVGNGPMLPALQRRYPAVHFAGAQSGSALVRHYAAADVMVMPSRTETFGLVMLEALACGVPVAAYPAAGPNDVIGDSGAGALDDDLGAAVSRALDIPRDRCVAHARRFDWQASIDQFASHLAPIRKGRERGRLARKFLVGAGETPALLISRPCHETVFQRSSNRHRGPISDRRVMNSLSLQKDLAIDDGLLRTAGASPSARRRRHRLLPVIVLFTYWPVARVLGESLAVGRFAGEHAIGFGNYLRLFADPHFARAAWNNAVYAVGTIVPSLFFALALALALRESTRLNALLRTLVVMPLLIPLVAAAALFTFILLPGEGLLDFYLRKVGIGLAINWLGDPDYALAAVIAVTVWKNTGYYMLFFIAGLAGVPQDLVDAAKIDGAGPWRRLRAIILPMLGPTFGFVVPIALLNALTQIDHVITVTEGGPSDATNLLLYYIYQQAAQNNDTGLAAAATVISVAALLSLSLISFRLIERGVHYES